MAQNRWVQPPADPSAGGGGHQLPPISSLAVVYRSDPDLVRAVVPPPLQAAPDAKVHLRFTDIDLDFDEGGEAARRVKSRLRLEDIEKAGRGILVEVEEEDGDQVLVWLR